MRNWQSKSNKKGETKDKKSQEIEPKYYKWLMKNKEIKIQKIKNKTEKGKGKLKKEFENRNLKMKNK